MEVRREPWRIWSCERTQWRLAMRRAVPAAAVTGHAVTGIAGPGGGKCDNPSGRFTRRAAPWQARRLRSLRCRRVPCLDPDPSVAALNHKLPCWPIKPLIPPSRQPK